jgi:outer membrane murein-binding lipoprotein Lpp
MSIEELKAENARLKAEVEAQAKRWAESEDLISHYKEQRDEVINDCQCSRLKAEVEELKSQPDPLTVYLYADTLRRDDIKTLQAQVERLTKAGDAMAAHIERNDERCYEVIPDGDIRISDWNAAKEGKGQP